MNGSPLTVQTLASAVRRPPRLVRASASIRIGLPSDAISARRADRAGIAACATCAVGACEGGVADLIGVGDAAIGEVACWLTFCHGFVSFCLIYGEERVLGARNGGFFADGR